VLVAAAVCPHPPLLVPGVGAGASGELDGLRMACDAAVRDLLAADPSLVVVVGGAPVVGPYGDGAWGSLAGFGVRVPVGSGPGEPTLPLSLTLGRWLLDRADGEADSQPLLFGVEPDAGTDRCLALGEALAGRADRVALLVMGDGSARRSLKGPGGLHPDPAHAADLLAAGRAPWQVLAGAARGGTWHGAVTWTGSPYGVTYLVATWTPAG
jgi:hypothetical protein